MKNKSPFPQGSLIGLTVEQLHARALLQINRLLKKGGEVRITIEGGKSVAGELQAEMVVTVLGMPSRLVGVQRKYASARQTFAIPDKAGPLTAEELEQAETSLLAIVVEAAVNNAGKNL